MGCPSQFANPKLPKFFENFHQLPNCSPVFEHPTMGNSCRPARREWELSATAEDLRLECYPEAPTGWVQGHKRIPGSPGQTEPVYWKWEGNRKILHRQWSFPMLTRTNLSPKLF